MFCYQHETHGITHESNKNRPSLFKWCLKIWASNPPCQVADLLELLLVTSHHLLFPPHRGKVGYFFSDHSSVLATVQLHSNRYQLHRLPLPDFCFPPLLPFLALPFSLPCLSASLQWITRCRLLLRNVRRRLANGDPPTDRKEGSDTGAQSLGWGGGAACRWDAWEPSLSTVNNHDIILSSCARLQTGRQAGTVACSAVANYVMYSF